MSLSLARTLDRLPRRLVILAVEATECSLGLGLSPPVAAALPELITKVTRSTGL
jgi:hydrogenase maturation protease